MTLREELAPKILPVVLANITTSYPYLDSNLFTASGPSHDPAGAHPAFGNSFDWHSSVHSHWTALQLPGDPQLSAAIQKNLTRANLEAELEYLKAHPAYERPYGWAWAMALASRVEDMRDMATWIADAAIAWMNALPMPVRHGTHANTAFALGLMLDAARALHLDRLKSTVVARAVSWFEGDRSWPVRYERSGNDFLSPGLAEADLMRRVLSSDAFASWWNAFLPELGPESPLLSPADVPSVEDGHIVHLHGLNLSRAAQLARIGSELNDDTLCRAARVLYDMSYRRSFQGHYTETHWLPTFAWDAALSIDSSLKTW